MVASQSQLFNGSAMLITLSIGRAAGSHHFSTNCTAVLSVAAEQFSNFILTMLSK
jgi:hypothetical protein